MEIKYGLLCLIPLLFIGCVYFINVYLLGIVTFVSCGLIFNLFPFFVKFFHTRPIYYEDILIIDTYEEKYNRRETF